MICKLVSALQVFLNWNCQKKNYKRGPGKVLISEAEETGTQNWPLMQFQKEFLCQIVSDNSDMM
jgi:hypothetical protein